MRKFLIQVSITAASMLPYGPADHVMTVNAVDALEALNKAFSAYPEAICFDAYVARGDFRHIGTFGTELPAQWAELAAGVTS